ncbi:MAG: serine hydrolase [Gemmatimonadetes bacterium]|nr:serine hydrolase [Gemmatimonadota bacterium]
MAFVTPATPNQAHSMVGNRFQPVLSAFALLATTLALVVFPAGANGQVVDLAVGQTVAGTLARGDTAEYRIEAGEDYFIFGEIDQISVDAVVRVLNPEGEQRARVDVTARGADRFSGETRNAGTYTIQVIPFEDEEGEYTITLHRLEPLETDPDKLVDQLMSPYDTDDSPGAAVRVWRDGRTLFSKTYGMADLAYRIPFETDTRTNIGSTSKQFTAFAVMLQAERGALSLDDDIRLHVPELPEFDQTITVRHLLTHTSGLREIFNLLVMTGRRIDRGDYVDRDEILAVVQKQPALQNAPGAEWNYNNTAFALAALIVERTSDQPFDEFMADHVFGPLGMTRTMVRPHAEFIVPERSQGYAPASEGYREIRDLGASVGAGGIYSTIEDLQTWVENYIAPEVGSPAIVEEMTTPFILTDGDTTNYGLGLFIDEHRGLKRVHHGGADIAHRSMLAYYPELRAGITTQSNHASFDSNVTFRLAEAFFDDAMEPETPAAADDGSFDPASYDPDAFDDFVGRYALDAAPTFILSFSREGETLYTQATGQPRIEIEPTSDSTFALTVVEASVVFHRDDAGGVEGVTLFQGGQEQHATRLDDDADDAGAWEPTPDDLEEFAGHYLSDEIETFYTVAYVDPSTSDEQVDDEDEAPEPHLVLQHRRLDDATLTPGELDTFSGGGLTLTFERDRNGMVLGFYLSNTRTRDVRFERVR